MDKASKNQWWVLPGVALFVLGFVVAGLWDMPIDVALHPAGQGNAFAVLMEAFGWYPAFVPPILLAMLWGTQRGLPAGRWWQLVVCNVVWAGGCGALYFVSWKYLVERGWLMAQGDARVWVWLAAGVAVAAACFVLVLRLGPELRARLVFFGLWGSVYMAANQVVVYGVKTLWARTRFDDMVAMGSFADFTPWWQPLGQGGSSFPSGHTANAAGILVLLVLCDVLPRMGSHRKLVTALCWAYIAAMAFARILIGRHFLSDTLAASLIMGGLLFVMRRIPPYQKSLARARQNPPGEGEEPHAV